MCWFIQVTEALLYCMQGGCHQGDSHQGGSRAATERIFDMSEAGFDGVAVEHGRNLSDHIPRRQRHRSPTRQAEDVLTSPSASFQCI